MLHSIALLVVFLAKLVSAEEHTFWICESKNPKFIGEYLATLTKYDGYPAYENESGMSLFRSRGFWYLGNLEPWPPETHFRCSDPNNCPYESEFPPTDGIWTPNKKFTTDEPPVIRSTRCNQDSSVLDEL